MSDASYAGIGGAGMADNAIAANNVRTPHLELTMKTSFLSRAVLAATMTAAVLLAAGCDKYTDSGQTVGQKLDSAIDKTNAKMVSAADAAGSKVDQAGAAVSNAGKSISNTTGSAINKAGDAVFSKVDQVGVIVDDSAITASIKADLLKDPGLSALGIEVNTVKGEVTLKGTVSTEVRKQRAEGIASHIVGVTKTINLLKVSGS
jgi:osmotically-inducible protein OsmY